MSNFLNLNVDMFMSLINFMAIFGQEFAILLDSFSYTFSSSMFVINIYIIFNNVIEI